MTIEHPDSLLLIPKKSFKTKLSHYIQEADSLKSFNQISENHLKIAKESHNRWNNRVTSYLEASYSSDLISKKFFNGSGIILMKSAPFQDRCEKLIDDIDEGISRLEMIIEKEDIKAEIHPQKIKHGKQKSSIQWNLVIKILVSIIGAFAVISAALIGRSSSQDDQTKPQSINSNRQNVIINNNINSEETDEAPQ